MRRVWSGGHEDFCVSWRWKKVQLTSSEIACVHEQVANANWKCLLYLGNLFCVVK